MAANLTNSFRHLSAWTRSDAIDHIRRFSKIELHLTLIAVEDLGALRSIWKCVVPRHFVIFANDAGDADTRERIWIVSEMMRACPRARKIIHIGRVFIDERFAAFFAGVVFDKVYIHTGGDINGAAIPPCRYFEFDREVARNISIAPTDALVSSVTHLYVSERDEGIATYRHLAPEGVTVSVESSPLLLDRVGEMFPRIRKLRFFMFHCPGTELAGMVSRFQALDTLVFYLNAMDTQNDLQPFFRAVGALPHVRRLRIRTNGDHDLKFLLEMPRLEKLTLDARHRRVKLSSNLYMLPRLRSIVFYQSGVRLSDEQNARLEICAERQCFLDDVSALHSIVARAFPSDTAQLVCLMIIEKHLHPVVIEIMRNPPERNTLDDQWDLEPN